MRTTHSLSQPVCLRGRRVQRPPRSKKDKDWNIGDRCRLQLTWFDLKSSFPAGDSRSHKPHSLGDELSWLLHNLDGNNEQEVSNGKRDEVRGLSTGNAGVKRRDERSLLKLRNYFWRGQSSRDHAILADYADQIHSIRSQTRGGSVTTGTWSVSYSKRGLLNNDAETLWFSLFSSFA